MIDALIATLPPALRGMCKAFCFRSFAEMRKEVELQEGVSRAWALEVNRAVDVAEGRVSLEAEKAKIEAEMARLQRKLEYLREFDDPETAYANYRRLYDESVVKVRFMKAAIRILKVYFDIENNSRVTRSLKQLGVKDV